MADHATLTSPLPSVTYTGTATALTSISHAGETRGTLTLLRRERIILPNDSIAEIPIISGNCLRGALRRRAEEQLRDVLGYTGQLSLAAAHTLRAGGALAKTSHEPLSGSRLATLRAHIPVIGLFGAATSGRIIDGCLEVGKLIPHLAETSHLTGVGTSRTAFDAVQIEYYTQTDTSTDHHSPASPGDNPDTSTTPMRFGVETFPAGSHFAMRLHLKRPTLLEAAFFAELLATYQHHATVGGRLGIGHGRLKLDLTPSVEIPAMDWRAHLQSHRSEALEALKGLS